MSEHRHFNAVVAITKWQIRLMSTRPITSQCESLQDRAKSEINNLRESFTQGNTSRNGVCRKFAPPLWPSVIQA